MSLPKRPPLNNPIPNADIPNTPEEYIVKAPYWDAVVSGNLTVSGNGSLAIGGSVTPPLGQIEVQSQYWNMPLGNGIGVWNGELRNVEPDFPPFGCRTDVFTYGVTDFTDAWRDCTFSSFPADMVTGAGVNFSYAWFGCENLASFPALDFSNGEDFTYAWCLSGIRSFSNVDVSNGSIFYGSWLGCSELNSFPELDLSKGEDFSGSWQYCSNLISFPALDFSSATDFSQAWQDCSSLTSFPVINTSLGTDFKGTWSGCYGLTSFPVLDFSSAEKFGWKYYGDFPFLGTWYGCSNLVDFPAGLFDNCSAIDFQYAWTNCALSQQSVDNILVSLDTAGQENGVVGLNGGTSAYPSSTGIAARDSLVDKGWTVNLNTIVTQGLILNLDAGNPASYPGTGTVWSDLSGLGNDGTLVNGVSYDSANGGSLVFDGVDDYVDILLTNGTELASLTLFCFIKPQGSFEVEDIIMHSGFRFMTRAYRDGGGYGTGWAFWPTPNTGTLYEGSTLSLDTWYCLAVTYTTSQLKLYTNTVCDLTVNNPGALIYGNELQICHGLGSFQHFTGGKIPVMMVYNRALTSEEVAQNYDALKGRFGL